VIRSRQKTRNISTESEVDAVETDFIEMEGPSDVKYSVVIKSILTV